MNFYKLICIIALVLLILCLTAVGVALRTSSQEVLFPPNVSECPDFYIKNISGKCVNNKGLGDTTNSKCDNVDFNITSYNFLNPGMGPTSGMCAKKKWANDCEVNWDGITNNDMVCYQTIE